MRARAQRHHEHGLLANLLQAIFVGLAHARALDERDDVILAALGHRFAELHNLHRVEQIHVRLQRIDHGELAAFADW